MHIEVQCPCGKRLRVRKVLAGLRVKCPECGKGVLVPRPAEEDSSDLSRDTYGLVQEPGPKRSPVQWDAGPTSSGERRRDDPLDAAEEKHGRPDHRKTARMPRAGIPALPRDGVSTVREYAYLVLCLTLIPLILSLFRSSDFEQRLDRTLRANPQVIKRLEERKAQGREISQEDLFQALPGNRIEGAHLPRGSWGHWLYALASGMIFFGIVLTMFRGNSARPQGVILVGVFTATLGIFFLLLVQLLAAWTEGRMLVGRSIVVVLFYVLKFIGFSYRSALDEDSNFLLSMLGFTMGVGLCEELVKALPLLWHYTRSGTMGWRGACLWGLATGVGFGVSEGITYSSDFYNGLQTSGIYVVRFVSCVALHAVWSASVALLIWQFQGLFQQAGAWHEFILPVFLVLAGPMVAHGLYDTFLKKEMNALALAVALGSFLALAFQIERNRRLEGVECAGAS